MRMCPTFVCQGKSHHLAAVTKRVFEIKQLTLSVKKRNFGVCKTKNNKGVNAEIYEACTVWFP